MPINLPTSLTTKGAVAILAGVLLSLSPDMLCALPQKVLYQGTLRRSGTIFTGSGTFLFRVTDATGASEYWTSGSTVVAVTAGLFRYPLGVDNLGGTGLNSKPFANIPWALIEPYVEVTVDGILLSPREPLSSVPYALYLTTGDAFSVGGSTFVVTGGRVGIGTTSPRGHLDVSAGPNTVKAYFTGGSENKGLIIENSGNSPVFNSVGTDPITLGSNVPGFEMDGKYLAGRSLGLNFITDVSGTGTQVLRLLPGTGAATAAFLSAKVGAGTTAPQGRLEIRPAAGDDYSLFVSSQNAAAILTVDKAGDVLIGNPAKHDTTADSDLFVKGNVVVDGQFIGHTASGSSVTFTSGGDFIVGTSTLVVTSGKVGIGTTNPGDGAGMAGQTPIFRYVGYGNLNQLRISGADTGNTIYSDQPGGIGITTNGGRILLSSTGGIHLAAGNVGVGTTAPATLLDVNGSAQFGSGANKSTFTSSGNLEFSLEKEVRFRNDGRLIYHGPSAVEGLWLENFVGGKRNYVSASGGIILGTGNVGITGGSITAMNPAALLHVTSGTLLIDGNAATSFKIGASTLTVTGSGNVGIGATNPTFNLMVGGYPVASAQLWGAASWSQSSLIAFTASTVNDGSAASAGFHTDTSPIGSTLQLDAGVAKAFTGVAIFSGRSLPQANISKWNVEFSDDAASWTAAYIGIDLTTNMGGWIEARWQVKNVNPAHRYWRLYKTNAAAGGDYVYEVQFFEGAAESGVVRTDAGGNVGIGTANPAGKLEVRDGDVRLSTTSGSRGIVFQDGSTQVFSGKVINMTYFVDSTRSVLGTPASVTFASFTVNKKSSTSNLICDATIAGFGDHAGSMNQGWKLGAGTEVLGQGIMYSASTSIHGRIYPSKAVIAGHTTTGAQTMVFRYFTQDSTTGNKPFVVLNPNSTDDARLGQTQSVYTVWEVEPQ